MEKTVISFLAICLLPFYTGAADCENGWTAYKDEICFHASSDVFTYQEAQEFCLSKGSDSSKAALVLVKELEVQAFLADFTKDLFDNLWLGGKSEDATGEFQWEDGTGLTYTNWAEGYPRNNTGSDACIQLRPVNAKRANNLGGKWEDTSCQRRNLALCQQNRPWSMEDATRAILSLRSDLQATRLELEAAKQDMQVVSDRVVPLGSIYVQYFNQSSPELLWPNIKWDDITHTYAGLFFRALGGNSEDWGKHQNECAPRIHEVQYSWNTSSGAQNGKTTLPEEGWSDWQLSGAYQIVSTYERLRFNIHGCEVRPSNQAVRIWKRVS